MSKKYLQVILLLGISLVYSEPQCNDPGWVSEGFLSDPCYQCQDGSTIQRWCSQKLSGAYVEPLSCCPDSDEESDDFDEYEDINDFSDSDGFSELDDLYDSDELSDDDEIDEAFPGSDLNDDELAGPITNENTDIQMPDPSSLEDYEDSIIPNPPSPVDFAAPSECSLAEVLGNSYIDRLDEAKQRCISEMKENLREQLNSYTSDITETRSNFETFLDEHSDELSKDEQDEIRSQISSFDQQVTQHSQHMNSQLQSPNCSEYTNAVKDESLQRAKDEYDRLEAADTDLASEELLCLEDYLRRLRTSVEECESQMSSLFQQLLEPQNTDIFYDKMCRKLDLELVKKIISEFFKEINYKSAYPAPVVEPEPEEPSEDEMTFDAIEKRRDEISHELEMLRQELNQEDSEREDLYQKLVSVSEQRARVENELNQVGSSESEERRRLEDLHTELLGKEKELKAELESINELLNDIRTEMQTLLDEEIELETQIGILPEQTTVQPTVKDKFDSIDEFKNNLGPGPVIPDHEIYVDEKTTAPPVEYGNEEFYESDDETRGKHHKGRHHEGKGKDHNENFDITEDEYLLDQFIFEEPGKPVKHKNHVQNYVIGIVLFILVLLGILALAVCIPVVIMMSRKSNRKVPYDKAALVAEQDPAILLKQTGFENPIYKFYSENSSKEDN